MRGVEQRACDLFMQNLVKSPSHLSARMEVMSAGSGEAMRRDDHGFATHRDHAHTLSKGASMEGVLAGRLGCANGPMGGRGGSMQLSDAAPS